LSNLTTITWDNTITMVHSVQLVGMNGPPSVTNGPLSPVQLNTVSCLQCRLHRQKT